MHVIARSRILSQNIAALQNEAAPERVGTVESDFRAPQTSLVTRNASIYFVAQVLSWGLSLLTVSIIPRTLGEKAMGQLGVAETICFTLMAILGLGMDTFVIREVGRDHRLAGPMLKSILGLRVLLIAFGIGISCLGYWLMKADASQLRIGAIYTIALCLLLWQGAFRSILSGWEMAGKVSLGDSASALGPLLALPLLRYGAVVYVQVVVVVMFLICIYRWITVRQRCSAVPTFNVYQWRYLLHGGIPFLMNDVILRLYGFSTIFILRGFAGDVGVGVLTQGTKLFGTFLFVPTAIGAALLPSMARLAGSDESAFRKAQESVLSLLVILGLPVSVLVFVMAHPLCVMLYSAHKFIGLDIVLQIMAFAILPVYIVTTMYQFLVVQNRAGIWGYVLLGTVAANAGLTWLLVPITKAMVSNSPAGAALANVIAEVVSATVALGMLRINPLAGENGKRVFRAIATSAIMFAAMWSVRNKWPGIPVAVGCIVFVFVGHVLKILSAEEKARISGLVHKITNRLVQLRGSNRMAVARR